MREHGCMSTPEVRWGFIGAGNIARTALAPAVHAATGARLQAVAARVDLHIIAAAGLFVLDRLPPPLETHRDPTRALVETFIGEIRVGIGGAGEKAAVLKCATGRRGVTPAVERVLRATARAQLATGAPICTHTHAASRNGLEAPGNAGKRVQAVDDLFQGNPQSGRDRRRAQGIQYIVPPHEPDIGVALAPGRNEAERRAVPKQPEPFRTYAAVGAISVTVPFENGREAGRVGVFHVDDAEAGPGICAFMESVANFLEKADLRPQIGFHVLVVIQVVLGKIREGGHIKVDPCDTFLFQRVGTDFHHHVTAPMVSRLDE